MFGISEIAIVLVIAIVVIGARKLPDLVRSAGKSARILKAEARAVKEQGSGERGSDEHGGPARPPRVIRGETLDRPEQ